jgi:hypothetical protein
MIARALDDPTFAGSGKASAPSRASRLCGFARTSMSPEKRPTERRNETWNSNHLNPPVGPWAVDISYTPWL